MSDERKVILVYFVVVSVLFVGVLALALITTFLSPPGVVGGLFIFLSLYSLNGAMIWMIGNGTRQQLLRFLIAWYPALLSDRIRDWIIK